MTGKVLGHDDAITELTRLGYSTACARHAVEHAAFTSPEDPPFLARHAVRYEGDACGGEGGYTITGLPPGKGTPARPGARDLEIGRDPSGNTDWGQYILAAIRDAGAGQAIRIISHGRPVARLLPALAEDPQCADAGREGASTEEAIRQALRDNRDRADVFRAMVEVQEMREADGPYDQTAGEEVTMTSPEVPEELAGEMGGRARQAFYEALEEAVVTEKFTADLGEIMARQVTAVDAWLDAECGPSYKEQPLAQTWARVSKVAEELGEAVAELILATGQNPRKQDQAGSQDRICEELADTAVTSVFAIQHFTKDARQTLAYFFNAMAKAAGRAEQAGYPS